MANDLISRYFIRLKDEENFHLLIIDEKNLLEQTVKE